MNTSRIVEKNLRPDAFKAAGLRGILERFVGAGCEDPIAEDDLAMVRSLVRRVLNGEDARTVFALDKKRRGPKKFMVREMAATLEVCRLETRFGLKHPAAVELVAEAFDVEPRSVERWYSAWRSFIPSNRVYESWIKFDKLSGESVKTQIARK